MVDETAKPGLGRFGLDLVWDDQEVHFSVGDKVFLKVSPWKGIMRFNRK
ncbi:hypothetical protein LINPERPRIM_LOCUS21996, partial [Linum perenne]